MLKKDIFNCIISYSMLKIIENSIIPYLESISPAIKVRVEEDAQKDALLLNIDGYVLSDDDKYLSNLIQLSSNPEENRVRVAGVSERQTYHSTRYQFEFCFAIDSKSLDYIEDRRHKNPKEDVVLKFNLVVTLLRHTMKMGDYTPRPIQGEQYILSTIGRSFRANANLNMLVPGAANPGGEEIFVHSVHQITLLHTIGASTWEINFQKALGIGKYAVVDLSEQQSASLTEKTLTGAESTFKDRLSKAYRILPKMEQQVRLGNWETVMIESRELVELFKKDVTKFVKEMISKTTQLEEKKTLSFTEMIDKLWDYANNFHHSVEKGKINPDYTVGKEDAYLTYAVSACLVNLLAKKFNAIISAK
jgi:hypothetical protein